jgi:SAM-dependent methyltransferase
LDEYIKTNQDWWNEAAQVHAQGDAYRLKAFKEGMIKLRPLERAEVGDVVGKKLLHLQCHFGLDTLSWARLGAQVVGIDYAEKAIAIARALSQELQLDATFVCCDLYNLPNVLDAAGQFDIVYTSYGVISWLPDLQPWGKIIAHYLKPGGFFYIAEGHPFMWIFDEKQILRSAILTFLKPPLRTSHQGRMPRRTPDLNTLPTMDGIILSARYSARFSRWGWPSISFTNTSFVHGTVCQTWKKAKTALCASKTLAKGI